jgi:hypothetical protein
MKKHMLALVILALPLGACSSYPYTTPKIDRRPPAESWGRGSLSALPFYNPQSSGTWEIDLRSYDLSTVDLRSSLNELLFASFDDLTIWPPADKMPEGYDPERIMELGKNPGLNIRSLHQEGITGKKIGIANIDQPLLVDHQEYLSHLRLFEELGPKYNAQMHGAAVASIAVGKTVGVAPDADLYFLTFDPCGQSIENFDFSCLAKAVRRVIEINKQLPSDRRIRVLSMEIGWWSGSIGYADITAAVEEARNAGIFIICSSEQQIYGFQFHGLGRSPLADPDSFESYEPGLWWADSFYQGQTPDNTLMVPMDSRAVASPTGNSDYVFYREGGWSWSIPYIAGVYALAAQVKPDITPDVFWSTALQTGQTIKITHEGREYSCGVILDPVALIHKLQRA